MVEHIRQKFSGFEGESILRNREKKKQIKINNSAGNTSVYKKGTREANCLFPLKVLSVSTKSLP